MKNEKRVLMVGLGFVLVCLLILHSCTRSFNSGVIYNAILPSPGWTNVLAHSTKAKIDPADTKLNQHNKEVDVPILTTQAHDSEQELEQQDGESEMLVFTTASVDSKQELEQHSEESDTPILATESVDSDQEDPYIDDDFELSGQLFVTDSYAVSQLLTNVQDNDKTKPSVTDSAEPATLSSTQVSISNSNGSNKLHTIVLYLAGQQASGVQALINIQCHVHILDLPVIFLEPVIVLNKFKAMPLVQYDTSGNSMTKESLSKMVVHFSDLFDLDIFNKFSSEMNYSQVAPRGVFFASAPRKIVLVHLYQGLASKTPRMTPLWPREDSPGDGGCFDPMKSNLDPSPKDQLRLLNLKGFCVFKAVTYRVEGGGQGLIFSEAELRESVLGDLPYSDFTLVFSLWMPKFVLPGTKGLQCLHSGYHSAKGQFQPSQRLLQNAQYYKEHFLNSTRRGGYLTLMIRLEHLYVSPRKGWTVTRCLDAAIAKIKEFQSERNFGKPFVTLDIGRYGSRSLRRNLGLDNVRRDIKYISELLSSVNSGQWNMKEWENSFTEATGGIVDSSYIAALQRTLASRAECLVLVGGGMFQELTMRKYLETRNINNRCIHLLCLKNDINSEIAKS